MLHCELNFLFFYEFDLKMTKFDKAKYKDY